MNVQVVFQQMIVIVALVCVGIGLYKKKYIDDAMTEKLSSIVVNVCNPLMCLSCGLETGITASHRNIAEAIGIAVIVYALLIAGGFLIPKLCRIKRGEQKFYNMMLVYANTGFIGIPVAKAVLPPEAMVYVIIFNILFSVFVYTHGMFVMKGGEGNSHFKVSFGMICSFLTILIFWFGISLPEMVADCIMYIGDATTFLSMTLLGCSFAAASIKTLFSNPKMYLFALIKMLLVPLGIGYVLSLFSVEAKMLQAFVLMLSMPAANMPLMIAKQHKEDTKILTEGILLTTLFTPVTLTIVSFVITKIAMDF